MRKFVYILLAAILTACTGPNAPDVQPQKQAVIGQSKSSKRGVAFNFQLSEDLPLLSPYISWDYNWGNTTSDFSALWFDANEIDYCPMCWNNSYNADKIRAYVAAHPSTKYLLAYNEPNLNDQAHMTPTEAAAQWSSVVALAKELNLKLISPAMNYGTLAGYSDPIKWLDEFFSLIDPNDIYAISVHCYMSSSSALMGYIDRFDKYNKPIWLTEFCAWDGFSGGADAQISYMCSALNALEMSSKVERYAWFIPRYRTDGTAPHMQLISSKTGNLTDAGKVYCYFPSFHAYEYLKADRFIHAGEYCATTSTGTQLRPTTDQIAIERAGGDGLMATSLNQEQGLTYHVYTSQTTSKIALRYTCFTNTIVEMRLDGQSINYVSLNRTGAMDAWTQVESDVPMDVGQHELEIIIVSGNTLISGFELK